MSPPPRAADPTGTWRLPRLPFATLKWGKFAEGTLMVRLIVLVLASLVGAAALSAGETKDFNKAEKVVLKADLEKILELVNKERARAKAPPLTLDPKLCRVAKDYS